MKFQFIKYAILSVGLLTGFSAIAGNVIYQCPELHGTFTNDQEINGWYFWADCSPEKVNVEKWPGQTAKIRGGKLNYSLVCHAGGKGPYYGVMRPVKANSCIVLGRNQFVCEQK